MTLFRDVVHNITKWVKERGCELGNYFRSTNNILVATYSGGDTALLFGCDTNFYYKALED